MRATEVHSPIFKAVSTTGIYCVASCAAKPHPRNITDYSTMVSAEAAGYRPCLRCRPDLKPEPNVAKSAPAPVAKALALITDGFLDTNHEDELARTVGYSARQLRRLFDEFVGASPTFVARSRRAHFARRLLDETSLPLADVARASGYTSTRQLHRGVTEIFKFSPSKLRSNGSSAATDGGLTLSIPHSQPAELTAVAAHLAARAIPGVECIDHGIYRRSISVCGHGGLIEIDLRSNHDGPGVVNVVAHLPTMANTIDDISRTRHLLGLDDASEAKAALGDDDLLSPHVKANPGLLVSGCWDRFETLIRIIVGQQISVAGASTMTGRLVEATANPVNALEGQDTPFLFPEPSLLADADLAGLGFTNRRATTVTATANAVAAGDIDLYAAGDLGEIVDQYTQLPGVGPWTAQLAALRLHRHSDAFAASDLGIRKGAAVLLGRSDLPSAKEVEVLSQRWRPHRALAGQLLWRLAANYEQRKGNTR